MLRSAGRRRRRTSLVLCAVVVAFSAVGCSAKKDKADPNAPLQLDPAERERGLRACKSYLERACRCAKTNAAFKKSCDEAEAHKTTLDMVFGTVVSDQVNNAERVNLIKSARKTIETCFSAMAQMDPRECPAGTE